MQNAETVYVASGKKILEFTPTAEAKEDLLKRSTGKTGNLRAPVIIIGKQLYIGYSQEMYEQLFGIVS